MAPDESKELFYMNAKILKRCIFGFLILFFFCFSFYPTYFEINNAHTIADPTHRQFILEHNYYWPDYNLYLSKIRQGLEGKWLAIERYTSEPHQGSLIQIFYVMLGKCAAVFHLTPNEAYVWTRIVLSLVLFVTVVMLVSYYFKSLVFQVLGFLFVFVSGSFPMFYQDNGVTKIGRYMEWWSNVDALQRISFIPHILFGQILSFFIFYKLTTYNLLPTTKKIIVMIILGNILGLVFPPSLMTLLATVTIMIFVDVFKRFKKNHFQRLFISKTTLQHALFILCSLPSLFYTLALTRFEPWATLVSLHRINHFIIPFDQFILATGPIFYLSLAGMIAAVFKKDRTFYPLLYWCITTFLFLIFYTYVKDQSPLRFTQTGLFIPMGILGTYFILNIWNFVTLFFKTGDASAGAQHAVVPITSGSTHWATRAAGPVNYNNNQSTSGRTPKTLVSIGLMLVILFYIIGSLFMMQNSLDWQIRWITQRLNATVPLVPDPPQAMYPLRDWMNGIFWLDKNTPADSVVLAEVTAGNYIPAYAHNIVYFGQANTVQYDRKQAETTSFFSGKMSASEAKNLMQRGRISYVFYSIQEERDSKEYDVVKWYPFLKQVYSNTLVTIYKVN
jgi:hypothetical protein